MAAVNTKIEELQVAWKERTGELDEARMERDVLMTAWRALEDELDATRTEIEAAWAERNEARAELD